MLGWDIFKEMEQIRREMDDVFRGLGTGGRMEPGLLSSMGARTYPRINLREDEHNFYVQALIPGVDPKSLDISVLKGTLTLSGERNGAAAKDVTWHRRERATGRFMRTVEVPAEIDVENIRADYHDGALEITLPKAENEKPKRIEIKAQ